MNQKGNPIHDSRFTFHDQELIPHLFRNEYSKIVAVLAKRFGFDQIETAEDIASETFLTASQSWGLTGVPANPVAWLYTVAKNKAKNHLHRNKIYLQKVLPVINKEEPEWVEEEINLSERNISDSQLQMMFTICHPSIPPEAQVGLSLRILCGFSVEEIATAFLSNKETINKRLFRAKAKLREEQIPIEFPAIDELATRLEMVLRTIYLLFNEGYYSQSQDEKIRKELCYEAMRLCGMLPENPVGDQPQVYALLALMCFHSSRLDARKNESGELIFYDDQDSDRWNQELIEKGIQLLKLSATGNHFTKYHIEAGIAYWNTRKEDTPEKWEQILQLYNQLLLLEYSPAAALNRTYVLARTGKLQEAIREANLLNLTDNHLYFGLLGELYGSIDPDTAIKHFKTALSLAKTKTDQSELIKKIKQLES